MSVFVFYVKRAEKPTRLKRDFGSARVFTKKYFIIVPFFFFNSIVAFILAYNYSSRDFKLPRKSENYNRRSNDGACKCQAPRTVLFPKKPFTGKKTSRHVKQDQSVRTIRRFRYDRNDINRYALGRHKFGTF